MIRILATFSLLSLLALPGPAAAKYDIVHVEENIAYAGMLTHNILVGPEDGGSGAEYLVLICSEGRTAAYVETAGYYGGGGEVRIRWKEMANAEFVPSRGGNGGTSVYFAEPQVLIQGLYEQGEVIVSVKGYAVSGAARFVLDRDTFPAIRALAEDCGWAASLELRETGTVPAAPQASAGADLWVDAPMEAFRKPVGDVGTLVEFCAQVHNNAADMMWARARGATRDFVMGVGLDAYPDILHDWVRDVVSGAFRWEMSPGAEERAIREFALYQEGQCAPRFSRYFVPQ